MKGFIEKINDGDNVHHVTKEEIEAMKVFDKMNFYVSDCHGYSMSFSDGEIVCNYCGEPCKMVDQKEYK